MSQSFGGGGGGNWGGPPRGGWGPPPGPPPGGGYGAPPPGGYGGPPPGGYGGPPGGFAPPPPGYPPGYTPMSSGGAVAWEDRSRGLFSRWWGTVKEACLNSRSFQAAAAQNDDPWPAVTFAVTNGAIVGLVAGLFLAVMYGAIGGLGALGVASSGGRSSTTAGATAFALFAAMGVGVAILLPLAYIVAGLVMPWIMGGLHHLALAMVGGASRPYSSTVRVVGYATAGQILAFVPMVGGMLSLAVTIISLVTGFEETHKCGTGKAVAGALLPFLIFGVCCCGCYIMMFAVGASAGAHHR